MGKSLILLITAGLLLAGYFFLPQFLGEILKNTFAQGTGCAVKLSHPKLNLVSLSASIEDVSIICKDEIKEEGFFADKVSVQIDSKSLWDKTIKVNSLKVEGTSTKSLIAQSAFLRTLTFILKKPEKPKIENSKRGWHVWVPKVEVFGKKSKPSILFGGRDLYISGESVEFSAEDPVDSRFTPVVLKAKASKAHLSAGDLKLSLGSLELVAEAGGGMLTFSKANFKELEQIIKVEGSIDTRNDIFNLGFEGGIRLSQFGAGVGSKSKGALQFKGHVKENIYSPSIESSLDFAIRDEENNECNINGSLDKLIYQDFNIKLENLTVQNIASVKEVSLGLGESISIKNSKPLELNFDADSLHACLPKSVSSVLKILGKGSQKLNFNLNHIQDTSNLELQMSQNGYDSLKLSMEHQEGRFKVATTFSLLGMKNNQSKIDFKYDDGMFDFENLQITSTPLYVFFDLLGVLNTNSLSEIINRSGFLKSTLTFNGSGLVNFNETNLSNFQGTGEVVGERVPLGSIKINTNKENSDLVILAKQNQKNLLSLKLQNNRLSGDISLAGVDITDLILVSPNLKELLKSFAIQGTFSGDVNTPNFSGLASLNTITQLNLITAQLGVDKSHIGAKLAGFSNAMTGDFSKKFDSSQAELTLDIVRLNLKEVPYLENLTEDDINVSGKLRYIGSFGSLLESDADVELSFDLPESLAIFQPTTPLHLNLKNGTLRMDDWELALPLSLRGYLNKSKGWNLDISGEVPLSSMAQNIDVMESMQGVVSISGQVRGDIFAPQIFGEAKVKDSSFNLILGDTILGAEGVNGSIKFSGDRIIIERISGDLADGEFLLRGQADHIFSTEARVVSLISESKNMKIEPFEGLFIDLSTNLSFGINKNVPTVLRGTVDIEEAVYENSINLDTLIGAVTESIRRGLWARKRATSSGKLSGVLADLHITSKGGMLLDTNVLQAEFLGDLHLSADIMNPYIEGRISVLDGGFKINQTDFQILSGELLFNHYVSTMNPEISLTSEGSLRNRSGDETKVYLSLGGTVKNTKLSLTSEGESNSGALAKQLGVGAAGNQLKLVDDRSSNVGFRELLSPSSDLTLLERVSGITGFDDVRVETGVSVRTGEFVPQVFASRPLPLDFRATISNELSGDKASGAKLEYRLDDSFSLFSSWRSQAVTSASQTGSGNLGVGFQYRRTFKAFGFLPESVKSREQAGKDE